MVRFQEKLKAAGVELACPACEADLTSEEAALCCADCGRSYPVLGGVPDLRLEPDRFLSLEDDRAKGMAVLERAAGRGYGAALEAYWSLTPELAPELAEGHLRRQLAEREAGAFLLHEIERRCDPLAGPILDVGCGLGGFVAASGLAGFPVVGLDSAFRWALLARLLLAEAGVAAPIVCANAESPPFRPSTFALAAANDLAEHARDPEIAVAGAARAARTVYLASTNRYSLAPEPHVRLFGVGWLPRERRSDYVRLRRGHAYDRVRPLSAGELSRFLSAAGLQPSAPFPAPVFAGHLSLASRVALSVLDRLPAGSPRVGVIGR